MVNVALYDRNDQAGITEAFQWGAVLVEHDGYGRPRVAGNGGFCSISYSADCAALAISRYPIGVDIEVLRFINAWDLWPYCAERERSAIRATDSGQERAHRALAIWTRKEAVLKLLGCGLLVPPECVDVSGTLVDITDALHVMRHDEALTHLAEEICQRSVEVRSWNCSVSADVRDVISGPKAAERKILLSAAQYPACSQKMVDSLFIHMPGSTGWASSRSRRLPIPVPAVR